MKMFPKTLGVVGVRDGEELKIYPKKMEAIIKIVLDLLV